MRALEIVRSDLLRLKCMSRRCALKTAAHWIARAAGVGSPVAHFVTAYRAASWLDTDRAFIESYQDPARTLSELQEAVASPKWGYHVHHVVEQTPARDAGFSEDLIESLENRVRIPALKHWEITGWFAKKNEGFGGVARPVIS